MAASDDLRLVELLCARLCHDLAGPIAGAAAGVELLADGGPAAADDVELLTASVSAAASHLKFLRAALGHGTTAMSTAELRDLTEAILPAGGAVGVDWDAEGHGDWPRPWARLVLNLVMVARDSLTRGGRIRITLRPQPPRVSLEAEGQALAPTEMLALLHDGDVQLLTPRSAQIYYLRRLAEEVGATIDISRGAGALRLLLEDRATGAAQ